jgi:hypothetical protein
MPNLTSNHDLRAGEKDAEPTGSLSHASGTSLLREHLVQCILVLTFIDDEARLYRRTSVGGRSCSR